MSWDHALEARLRARYTLSGDRKNTCSADTEEAAAVATRAGEGFVTEIAGKVILTAPARTLSLADELPEAMRASWEKASTANPYFMWVQGKFVEAEKANRNGAFWSTEDLQFGEMSVRHGPLNWLHDARQVIGTIADNKLVTPAPMSVQQVASTSTTTLVWNAANLTSSGQVQYQPRPYIAAVSAVWKWIYPQEAYAVEKASDTGQLYYSMECVAREVACAGDGDRQGCGASFPYVQAMSDPTSVCEHIRTRSSARRMVDPSFLGGAVIIPPVRPGWGEARAAVMRQAAALAEQVAPADANAADWERLMAAVMGYAAGT